MVITKTRGGPVGGLKTKNQNPDNFLLARGLSARYCGVNTPLTSLTAEEMERDLRHMEAFSNACIAYSQQYFIYQNSQEDMLEDASSKQTRFHQPAPLVAMPVRIDPEEEKRMTTLRQKIQQCEAQREVLESQYLSLRAHYVFLSQKLKTHRDDVNGRAEFLQKMVQKRGRLVALQRVRLQVAREALAALKYRQKAKKTTEESEDSAPEKDLVEAWNQIEEEFKKAEKECQSEGMETWQALRVPQIPPGVPLLLSQLAKQPGLAAAWSTGGMFGSKPDTLCWLEDLVPKDMDKDGLEEDLPALRSEVEVLRRELKRERLLNKDLQSNIISRRNQNDELVAMMALLRTETEAVVARHNILLQSDIAAAAAQKLMSEGDDSYDANGTNGNTGDVLPKSENGADVPTMTNEDEENDGDDEGEAGDEDDEEGEEGSSKRAHDGEVSNSPRTKRRKL